MIQEPFDNPDYVYALKHDAFAPWSTCRSANAT